MKRLIKWIMRILYRPKKSTAQQPIIYGLLYNSFAVLDARGLANTGWYVPGRNEVIALLNYLGAVGNYTTNAVGGKLKETGLTYWLTPNTGATNEVGFNGRGTGQRDDNIGIFGGIKDYINIWTTTSYFLGGNYIMRLKSNNEIGLVGANFSKAGNPVRLIKTTTTLSDGETGTYTGNNGRVYNTICINNQEWLSENLVETEFANGDTIPWHGAAPANYFTNAEWAALSTAGVCAYDNNKSNVYTGFDFS
jgi:uncharacterized protein (TIGR02145 family)